VLRLAHTDHSFLTRTVAKRRASAVRVRDNHAGSYPKSQPEKIDEIAEGKVALGKRFVNACRNLRSEMKISPALRVPAKSPPDGYRIAGSISSVSGETFRVTHCNEDELNKTDAPIAIVGIQS